MFSTLNTGAINVRSNSWTESLLAARLGGFVGVEFNLSAVHNAVLQDGLDAVRTQFDHAGLVPAAFSLPVNWNGEESEWRAGLGRLPEQAKTAAALGCTRTMTYIWPCSDEKSFEENWQFHVERFTPIAAILGEHGISLGLEFLGPKTLREEKRFPFVHTMAQMLEMGAAIGPNVGLLLDCWHWYTSGSTVDELRNLRAEQVVYVHLNDAPRGVERDEQQDLVRELPTATGVIDLAGFLNALQSIGYDGPLVVEPFSQKLRDLPTDAHRLATVRDSLIRSFEVAGLKEQAPQTN